MPFCLTFCLDGIIEKDQPSHTTRRQAHWMSKQKNKRTLNLWCPRAAILVLDSLPPAFLLLKKIKLLIYLSHYVGVSTALLSCSVMSYSLWPHGLQPDRLLCPRDSPGKNIEEGCHFLLQGIFPTQGLNPGLLHFKQLLYCLNYQGSPSVCAGLINMMRFLSLIRLLGITEVKQFCRCNQGS